MILPPPARTPPNKHTATYPTFPTNPVIGCIKPEKNCDFQALSYKLSLYSLNCSTEAASPLNALTTL